MKHFIDIDGRQIPISPLNVIRVVAEYFGYDIDVEPGVGTWRLKAQKEGGDPINANGRTFDELRDSFLAKLLLTQR